MSQSRGATLTCQDTSHSCRRELRRFSRAQRYATQASHVQTWQPALTVCTKIPASVSQEGLPVLIDGAHSRARKWHLHVSINVASKHAKTPLQVLTESCLAHLPEVALRLPPTTSRAPDYVPEKGSSHECIFCRADKSVHAHTESACNTASSMHQPSQPAPGQQSAVTRQEPELPAVHWWPAVSPAEGLMQLGGVHQKVRVWALILDRSSSLCRPG